MTDRDSRANAEQIKFWNSIAGPRWVRRQEMLDRQLAQLSLVAIDAAAVGAGDAVLDIGCGCGDSTLALAARVGERGRVAGLDISAPMLDLARDRMRRANLTNITFECSDAQTHAFRGDYDVVFSRFGVMFFDDPVAAFVNLQGALREGGRLTFVCWQSIQKNPWMSLPVMAALRHTTIATPSSPDAPGPFAFADGPRVENILAQAGFRDIAMRGIDSGLLVGGGGSVDEAVSFVLELGPVERALSDATDAVREAVRRDVHDSLVPYITPDGIRVPSAAWIVTAMK